MSLDRKQLIKNLGGVKEALRMSPSETHHLYRKYLNNIFPWIIRFLGMKVRIVKADGAYLIDEKGRRYLDFMAGFGALNFGHEPKEILQALHDMEGYPNLTHTILQPFAAKLAEYLAKITPDKLCRTFFCNSGTEAVEAAIKLARASTKKKVLVYAQGAFHGKTLGALSVSGREKYKIPFQPLVPETRPVPYGDSQALEEALKRGDAAGFIVEPIQGEGGVIVPPAGYLKKAEEICRRYNALLMVDEIQTGMGRTGKIFCFEHEQVAPDVLVLSKSLSGGVVPLGAMMTTDALWKKAYGTLETCLLHTSTFGGNARACAAGIASIRCLLEQNLDGHAAEMGEILISRLHELKRKHPVIREIRGKGLLIGLSFAYELGEHYKILEGALTLWMARNLFRRYGIISGFTLNNYNVLRVEPTLTIERKEIDYFISSFDAVLTLLKSDFKLQVLRKMVGT